MAERGLFGTVSGIAHLDSPFMSSRWRLVDSSGEVAQLRRLGRLHISKIFLPNGEEAVLTPHGQSVVLALDPGGNELARITRTSWFGRNWDVTSKRWAYVLKSDPRPRRWQITVGGTSVAQMTGSLVSYNKVNIEAPLGAPILVIALAWHAIARPWEAAAAPGTLVAAPASEDPL
ncbi:MAG: hypothetical protein GY926_15325 [bacterium]|nr:hypothetical protein [bacterium]MCP4966585.1 hypothetical protein [bacterium]